MITKFGEVTITDNGIFVKNFKHIQFDNEENTGVQVLNWCGARILEELENEKQRID